MVSYLLDTTYLNENMKIIDAINYFQDFMLILMSNELTNCSTICICIQIKIEQPFKREQGKSAIDFGDEPVKLTCMFEAAQRKTTDDYKRNRVTVLTG